MKNFDTILLFVQMISWTSLLACSFVREPFYILINEMVCIYTHIYLTKKKRERERDQKEIRKYGYKEKNLC